MIKDSKSLIFQEFNTQERVNWFDIKDRKFLHQIDTFYYTVKLKNDFTKDTVDPNCLKLRSFFQSERLTDVKWKVPFHVDGLTDECFFMGGYFDLFYNIHLHFPQLFDIYIADTVPSADKPEVASVTSEIVVQIRSVLLWEYGVTKAFEYSMKSVEAICKHFNLSILEVKENRVDYCWHTNYLQKPVNYFRIDKMNNMCVTRLGRKPRKNGVEIWYKFQMCDDGNVENDYIRLGDRAGNCFLRIYHKSKEVIEEAYKAWFLKEWLFTGLINRYDFYCLEKCYEAKSWKKMTQARLEFYLEYGADQEAKEEIREILDAKKKPADTTVRKLADKLTPKVTTIMNIEFQTSRKMSKTFKLLKLRDNSSKGVSQRIYDYFDNHTLITEYLTNDTFRLIKRTEENKSRCDMNEFWKSLRETKFFDKKKPPQEIKLKREYTRKLNSTLVKKRALSAVVSYNLYIKGKNEDDVRTDAADLLCMLNDNDIEYMIRAKEKRSHELSKLLNDEPIRTQERYKRFEIVDMETGEFI